MISVRTLVGSLLAGWLVVAIEPAQAQAVFSDTVLAHGPEFAAKIELPLGKTGGYKVTATDLKWFDLPLQALSWGVFSSSKPLTTMQGPGTLEFFKAGSDKLFLQVYAKTLGPRFAGLVTFQIEEQSPVPLPASLVLLSSAIGGSLLVRGAQRLRESRGRGLRAMVRLRLHRARAWVSAVFGGGRGVVLPA